MNLHLPTLALFVAFSTTAGSFYCAPTVANYTATAEMPRKPVRSSNIASIGYDESSKTLEVEFLNGAIYQYYNVPLSIYKGLMTAQSHGGYLDENVKDAGYQYKRVQ